MIQRRITSNRLRLSLVLALCMGMSVLLAGEVLAAPDPNWSVQIETSDCSGQAQQGTPECEDYDNDHYEHLDYSSIPSAETADIQILRTGYDDDYFYFEFEFVRDWDINYSTGHQIVVEIDVDADTEADRGDYYVGIYQKSEFDSTSWIDAYTQGCLDHGSNLEQMTEAVHVASAIRGGASLVHGVQMRNLAERLRM